MLKKLAKIGLILFGVFFVIIVSVQVGGAFIGSIISGLIGGVAEGASQGASQGGIGGFFQGIWSGLTGQFSKETVNIGKIASDVILIVCQWISSVLQIANNAISKYIFGDLLVLIDYQKIPQAGTYVTKFYNVVKSVGMSLAGFFFLITTGAVAFRSLARSSWKDTLQAISKLLIVLLAIQIFPTIFSLSISLVANITSSIMSDKVQGEAFEHAPTTTLQGSSNSIIAGIDQVARDIDYVLNLPDNLIQEGQQALNQATNAAIGYVEQQGSKLLEGATGAKGGQYQGIQSLVGGVIGKAVTGQTQGIEALLPSNLLNAALNIIISIISFTSLILLLSLFAVKGIQLVYLMALFLLAPLAFCFDVLPNKRDQILNYMGTLWGVMAWNVVWAIFIKIYFISNILVNVINSASASSQLTEGVKGAIPLAGIFMKMGVIALMDGVSMWITYLGFNQLKAQGTNMFNQVSSLPGTVRSISSGVGSFAGALTGAATGGLAAVGATAAIFAHGPKNVLSASMQGLSNIRNSVVGAGESHINRGYEGMYEKIKSLNELRNESESGSSKQAASSSSMGKTPGAV